MGARVRKDLFGIIDMIAIKQGRVLGVQSTGPSGRKAHMTTLVRTERESTRDWLESGAYLWLVSWKKTPRGPSGKSFRYEPVIDEITLELLEQESL